ncbi:MAG: S-adenosylmethionine:tRNA ribosyltransferase-isomerase, partial [Gemmatimonadetes bacterium]
MSGRGAGARVGDYDYTLPPERIQRYPSERRDACRLLVVDRSRSPGGDLSDRVFSDLPDLMRAGDLLVLNETRVLPARLLGRKPTGAPAEILLLRPLPERGGDAYWEALVRPGSKLKPGRVVVVAPELAVEIVDGAAGGGRV